MAMLDSLEKAADKLDAIRMFHGAGVCDEEECCVCGILDCPHDEPLHYHHDGCPAGCP